ncbi:MAG: thioredoxin domain-containing protein, partial [Desulfobacterales bacterium]
PRYAEAARNAARFILSKLKNKNGRLFHRFRDKELAIHAQAADYAFLIYGLISLYQATFDLEFAEDALSLQELMINEFWDDENGGFFTTGKNDELPVRPKELYDGAIPSANSVAFFNLLCLSRLTGNPNWQEKAQTLLRAFSGSIKAQPTASTFFLTGLDFALRPGQDIVITGKPEETDVHKLLSTLNLHFTPNKVTLVKSDQNADRLTRFAEFTDGLEVIRGETTAHLCENGSCTGSSSDIKSVINQILGKR